MVNTTIKPGVRLLDAEQIADRLSCSPKHARAMMANGTLPKVVLARRCVRTLESAVDELIVRRTIAAK